MEITAYKCEYCNRLFEDVKKYQEHVERHAALVHLDTLFPIPEKSPDFIRGITFIAHDEKWFHDYEDKFWELCNDYPEGMFNEHYTRLNCICRGCFKEWSHPYYTYKCHCYLPDEEGE